MTNDWYDTSITPSGWEATDFSAMGRDWQGERGGGNEWHGLLADVLLELGPKLLDHFLTGRPTDVRGTEHLSPELQEYSAQLQDARDANLTLEITNQLREIDQLTPEHWKTASIDQRSQALSAAVHEISAHVQRPVLFTVGDVQPGSLGECQPLGDAFRIGIAEELLVLDHPRDAIRTVVHELRHVHQHEIVQIGQWTGLDPYSVDVLTTQRWTDEFAAYSTDAHIYKNLGVEADAELFAVRVTDALYKN